MKLIVKYPLFLIIILYLIANMFMLANNGWYWDDWCLSTNDGLVGIYKGVGMAFIIPFQSWLINLTSHPALLYHIFTAVIEIIGIIIFYRCLTLLSVNRSNTFLLALFFAIVPYNLTKITFACFLYSIGLLFFLLAIFCFIYYVNKKYLAARIASLMFFFVSFLFLPSTLMLALSFFLFMALLIEKDKINLSQEYFRTIIKKLTSWADFILIPFIFWIFRAMFLHPSGVYATDGYREFTIKSLLLTPINLVLAFIQNFIGIAGVTNLLNLSNIYAGLFIIIVMILLFVLRRFKLEKYSNNRRILYIGLYFFFAGAIAYIMVGKMPLFDSYNSRHQILLRFGSAFILLYLVNLIRSEAAQRVIITVIVSAFIVSTIYRELQFQKSWFKQLALEKAFSNEKFLAEGVNFVVIDNTKEYNEYNNGYAFYCYTGILNKSFGTQTRFAINQNELIYISQINPQDFINNAFYNMKQCKNISSFDYSVIINPGKVLLSNIQCIKMLSKYYLNKTDFDNSLNEVLSLQVDPYKTSTD